MFIGKVNHLGWLEDLWEDIGDRIADRQSYVATRFQAVRDRIAALQDRYSFLDDAFSSPFSETAATTAATTAIVTTDKDDYAPGETVTITVTGLETGSMVMFQIADDPDDPGDDNEADVYEPWMVQDGSAQDLDGVADGNVTTTWLVPTDDNGTGSGIPDALNATLNLTATGSDGRVATTTFTDALNDNPTGNRVDYHNVYEIPTGLYTPGNETGYRERDTASFNVSVTFSEA
ncbi:MAG: hypothetical protein ACO36E_07475, partial [Synechocystis sp.]